MYITIHCAITYFDPDTKTTGYLIGADGRAEIHGKEETFQVDKSIRGKTTVGVIRGTFLSQDGEKLQDCFLKTLQSLEDVFDTITEDKDYSQNSILGSVENFFE